ncbi:MAG: hypothetical protein ABSD50_16535 [Smithella sp.]|jgi:hypothetical protein
MIYHGYAPQKQNIYNIIKYAAIFFGLINAGIILNLRISISNGISSGFLAKMLNPIMDMNKDLEAESYKLLKFMAVIYNSIATNGLVIFLLNGIKEDAYPFIIVALILLIFVMPTEGLMDKLAQMRQNSPVKLPK